MYKTKKEAKEYFNNCFENVDGELKQEYVANVVDFFAEAKVASKNYKNDIRMQDKQIQRSLRQLSRKVR